VLRPSRAWRLLIARDERRRASYTPEEVRARLQQRLAEAQARASGTATRH